MQNQHAMTPEGFRTAAYLEARARLDARRKTGKQVQCTPPNTRCGNRCIPPEWDCRLKGEGPDPHLSAVKTDPLGGLANIQRGFTRIARGLPKGNFSELEGGKRAIIRGTVKIAPGNINQKKDLKATLEERSRIIGISLAVLGGALGGHAILMRSNTFGYKYGAGRKVNEAGRRGVDAVLNVIPFVGQQRSYTRQTASNNLSRAQQRIGSMNALGGLGPSSRITSTTVNPVWLRGKNQLNVELNRINNKAWAPEAGSTPISFYEWNQQHRATFWKTKHVDTDLNQTLSIYARPSAENYLAQQWGISGRDLEKHSFIKQRISDSLAQERGEYVRLAQQQGFKIRTVNGELDIDPDSRVPFIRELTSRISSDRARSATADHLSDLLAKSPRDYSRSIYNDTVSFFDNEFTSIGKIFDSTSGASQVDEVLKREGYGDFLANSSQKRTQSLMSTTGKVSLKQSTGIAHEELFLLTYYHTKGFTRKTPFVVPSRIARSAAAEISGQKINSLEEAFTILNGTSDFRSAQPEVPTTARTRSTTQTNGNPPEAGVPRAARRRPRSRSQVIADLIKAGYTPEGAATEADRIITKRNDEDDNFTPRLQAYFATRSRLDFTPPNKREGKPCGKSFVPKAAKCSKPTSARYAEESKQPTDNKDKATKIGTALIGAAAVIGAVRNRKKIGRVVRSSSIKLGRSVKKNNPSLYRKTAVRARLARRVSANVVRTQAQDTIADLSKRTIKKLSSTDVDNGIGRLPSKFQQPVRKLVGDAKLSAAHIALKSRGAKIISVDNDANFSNWKTKDGTFLSTGSVGETLVIYNSKPQDSIGGVQAFSTQFRIDGEFDAKSPAASRNSRGVATLVKKMFKSQVDQLPDNSIITAIPYSVDKKGKKRKSIYERYGFRQVASWDERLFALKHKGQFTRMNDNHIDQLADIIRNDSLEVDDIFRADKRCGKSGIPDNQKCTKTTAAATAQAAAPQASNVLRNVGIGAGATVAVGAIGAFALIGMQKNKATAYRRNVPKSAIEAEKLAIEYERQFRDQAAQRLGKRSQDVTGYEASVYNYRDKGYDRGFGSFESDPKWFGQTKQSKGAVVILSYADERGKGGFNMADSGTFKTIWGDRDILPYANNISQPASGSGLDDLQVKGREKVVKQAGEIVGKQGKDAVKSGFMFKDALDRFKFLRDNVNERGFNPDAVRAAAFVAAQRRLTGKPVDILSYSNGGNVATEALAILSEMGYRDVKVVNIAGPTFGIFNHKPENMRTWVSEGDEFHKVSGGKAFVGGNTRYLKNKNIPHGLMDGVDPNNRENGANARANVRAKNSYMLDEQLRQEAYQFLNVDKKRSQELTNEIIWRVSENKPFEGDLGALFGEKSATTRSAMAQALSSTKNREETKQAIRDQIEERMLDVWYGGYNASRVKKAQAAIQKELQTYTAPQQRTPVKPPRPQSMSQRITTLMEQNPGMTREAARNNVMRERRKRSDAYDVAYKQTAARLYALVA